MGLLTQIQQRKIDEERDHSNSKMRSIFSKITKEEPAALALSQQKSSEPTIEEPEAESSGDTESIGLSDQDGDEQREAGVCAEMEGANPFDALPGAGKESED